MDEYTLDTKSTSDTKYTLDDILTMLGGFQYFSEEDVYYVYHHVNGHTVEAEYYLNIIQHKQKQLQEAKMNLR